MEFLIDLTDSDSDDEVRRPTAYKTDRSFSELVDLDEAIKSPTFAVASPQGEQGRESPEQDTASSEPSLPRKEDAPTPSPAASVDVSQGPSPKQHHATTEASPNAGDNQPNYREYPKGDVADEKFRELRLLLPLPLA